MMIEISSLSMQKANMYRPGYIRAIPEGDDEITIVEDDYSNYRN